MSEPPPGAIERDLHEEFLIAYVCGHEFEPEPEQEISESGRRDIFRCPGCGARVVLCYKRGSDQPFETWMEGKAARRCPAPPPRSEKPPATQDLDKAREIERQRRVLAATRSTVNALDRLRRLARHCDLVSAFEGFRVEEWDTWDRLDEVESVLRLVLAEIRAAKRDRLRQPPGR